MPRRSRRVLVPFGALALAWALGAAGTAAAGDVAVGGVTPGGDVRISGDQNANDFTVTQNSNGTVTVTANGTGTTINGGTSHTTRTSAASARASLRLLDRFTDSASSSLPNRSSNS